MFYDFDRIRIIYVDNKKFFAFLLDEEFPSIVDYTFLDREPTYPIGKVYEFDKIKEKKIINSTHELSEIFKELILYSRDLLLENSLHVADKDPASSEESTRTQIEEFFDIDSRDMKLLINELVIGVLYNKYRDDTQMTLNEYCSNCFYSFNKCKWEKFDDFEIDEGDTETINKEKANAYKIMERRVQAYVKTQSTPFNQEVLKEYFSFNDIYIEYISEKRVKKPKWLWDLIYYDYTLTAVKQFRGNLGNSEENLINELKVYDKFVDDVFKPKTGDDKDYYYKSMDLYYLESTSHLEFAYKLVERLEKEAIINISNVSVLKRQFSPWVNCPIVKEMDGNLVSRFMMKRNFYFPLLLMEESWLRRMDYEINEGRNNPFCPPYIIHAIRAQAYELFKYHYNYVSDSYDDISAFIKENYNLLEKYIDKGKIWKHIKNTGTLSSKQKKYVNHMQVILSTIFKKVTKDDIKILMNSNNKNIYQELFGINKEVFEKMLHILENEAAKLYSSGGRKPSLSVLDKLVVTFVYCRYIRTTEDIASDYGVSKRQISEAINWVSNTLKKNITENNL